MAKRHRNRFCPIWACIVLEGVLEPHCKWLKSRLGIDESTYTWRLFQSAKVFVLVSAGNVFFRMDSLRSSLHVLKLAVSHVNPWIFFDGSLTQMGLTYGDINILIIGSGLLCAAGYLQNRYGSAREWFGNNSCLFAGSYGWLCLRSF